MTALPLAGKRILVTRMVRQAGNLNQALEAQGAVAVPLPTIALEPPASYAPLDAALAAAADCQWLILTSANAARVIAERMSALNLAPDHLAHLRVACVGEATAKAAAEAGLAVALVPSQYVAESLVEALRRLESSIAGQRVLLVRAAVARDLVPDQLRRMGAQVQVIEAYRTVVPNESIENVRVLLAAGAAVPDAATFTSSSTVTNFLDLLRAAGVERPAALRAVSIGPITSRTLREHGWEPAAEAAHASIDGLVEACVRSFGA